MKYPKMPPELDRRKKIMPMDKILIRIHSKLGETNTSLARRFNVSLNTIARVISPAYDKMRKDQANARNKMKYKTDPDWVARKRVLSNESHKYKRTVVKEEKKYDFIQHKNYICKLKDTKK